MDRFLTPGRPAWPEDRVPNPLSLQSKKLEIRKAIREGLFGTTVAEAGNVTVLFAVKGRVRGSKCRAGLVGRANRLPDMTGRSI